MKIAKLFCAANGFAVIETDSLAIRFKLGLLLTFRYGFYRRGTCSLALAGDSIHPSFVRGKKTILAGWDDWKGYYFLADNDEADKFLKVFYQKHCLT